MINHAPDFPLSGKLIHETERISCQSPSSYSVTGNGNSCSYQTYSPLPKVASRTSVLVYLFGLKAKKPGAAG
jgi:hypothetical protein